MLSIKNLTKTYKGGKKAVSNLNIEVESGDIYGFIGHNGAGKTTTIKAVVGIIDFEEGEIHINGISVKDDPLACKSCIAYIPDIDEQLSIASFLDKTNKKIETNNAIISELESMAKDIYDYWFVQFDFPDENGKPYKSSGGKMVWNEELKREIPEGWKVIEINKMFESKRGISYNTETITGEGIPMINLASFNVNSTYKKEGLKSYSGKYSDEDIIRPYDLLMCNTQQTDLDPTKDIIGKTILVPDIFGGSDIVASHLFL